MGEIMSLRNIRRALFALVLYAAPLFPVHAAPAEDDTIVVTATRVPTSIERIGSSVTIISAADIDRNQWRTIGDALASVPGLQVVQSGGPGAQTSVFSRGTNSSHTLILVDGIEAADPSTPSGAFDFANMQLEDVERIEVVRGPQSTLYGSDAIGAVINVITHVGHGPLAMQGQLEGGSFQTFSETAGVSGALGGWNYALQLTNSDSDGRSITPERLRAGAAAEDDGYENTTASVKLGYAPTADTSLQLVARHIKARADLDVGSGEDADSKSETRQQFLRMEAKGAFFKKFWRPTFAISDTTHKRRNTNERQSSLGDEADTQFRGEKTKFEFQNDLYLPQNNVLTLGAETEKEKIRAAGTLTFGSALGDFIITDDTAAEARTNAFYVQDQFDLSDRVQGNLGVRFDNPDTFATHTSWRATSVYAHRETTTRLKASYGTGYRAPSLHERFGLSANNFGSAFRGNPGLKPEENKGWEAGFEQAVLAGRVEFGATYFKSELANLIQTIFLPSFDSTTANVAEAKTAGTESYVVATFAPTRRARLDYTYTDTTDNQGRQLLRRPRHATNLSLEEQITPRIRGTLQAGYVGERSDVDRSTGATITTGGYTLLHITGAVDFSKRVTAFARIHNVLDRRYEPADGFQGLPRGIYAGVRARF